MKPYFKCIKTGEKLDFGLNIFNNPNATHPFYSSIYLEGGYKVSPFLSPVPFKEYRHGFGGRNTPLKEIEGLKTLLGLRNVAVKDEWSNPFGTHKDRRSEYIVNVAAEHGVDKIVCLTAGNAGYSLSRYCVKAGIDYTSLVLPRVSKERRAMLAERGNVAIIDGGKCQGILRPRNFGKIIEEFDKYERQKQRNNIRSVTNSFEPISMNAYKELMYELKDENPDYIVVPCGSGDIIVGIWLGIQELGLKTKIIGVGPKNEHPLKMALVSGNDENTISTYKDLSVADKLTTSFTAVLPLLYHIFTQSGNLYAEVSNEEIIKTKKHLEELGLKVENSAVTAFATFLSYERPQIDPDSKIIIVSTGKGIEL